MYPPVALNQYTWVNRTHKHFIYIYASSRPHKHYKIDFTPKLSSHQHVKYGSNLMNFFFKFHFWGVLGKRMLNSEVLKCHEDLITLETYVQQGKQWIISFSCVKTLTSLAIWEGGGGAGFNNQTLHIYPLFNNNLHVKYRSKLIRTF